MRKEVFNVVIPKKFEFIVKHYGRDDEEIEERLRTYLLGKVDEWFMTKDFKADLMETTGKIMIEVSKNIKKETNSNDKKDSGKKTYHPIKSTQIKKEESNSNTESNLKKITIKPEIPKILKCDTSDDDDDSFLLQKSLIDLEKSFTTYNDEKMDTTLNNENCSDNKKDPPALASETEITVDETEKKEALVPTEKKIIKFNEVADTIICDTLMSKWEQKEESAVVSGENHTEMPSTSKTMTQLPNPTHVLAKKIKQKEESEVVSGENHIEMPSTSKTMTQLPNPTHILAYKIKKEKLEENTKNYVKKNKTKKSRLS